MSFKKFCDFLSSCGPSKHSAPTKKTIFYSLPNAPLAPSNLPTDGKDEPGSQTLAAAPQESGSLGSSAVSALPEPSASGTPLAATRTTAPPSNSTSVVVAARTSTGPVASSGAASATSEAPLAPGGRATLPNPHAPPPDTRRPVTYSHIPRRAAARHAYPVAWSLQSSDTGCETCGMGGRNYPYYGYSYTEHHPSLRPF